jgi:hypothetical protein
MAVAAGMPVAAGAQALTNKVNATSVVTIRVVDFIFLLFEPVKINLQ